MIHYQAMQHMQYVVTLVAVGTEECGESLVLDPFLEESPLFFVLWIAQGVGHHLSLFQSWEQSVNVDQYYYTSSSMKYQEYINFLGCSTARYSKI